LNLKFPSVYTVSHAMNKDDTIKEMQLICFSSSSYSFILACLNSTHNKGKKKTYDTERYYCCLTIRSDKLFS